MNNESMFIKSFQKCRRGELSPVLYCNNVAIIGEKVIDNRGQVINRGHKQQTELKFTSKRSGHFWKQSKLPDRMISALDTISTMQHGIRFRSDVKRGNCWEKRAVYLWHNFVVVSRVHPKHLVTCYKIEPISKSAFELYVSLKKEENNTLRNCKTAV
jgi:hypothetical protein